MDKQFIANGLMIFRLGSTGIETQTYNKSYYVEEENKYITDLDICNQLVNSRFTKTLYDMFDGKEFLEKVREGYITDYDGVVANVFLDGYVSNLGLATDNLVSSGFLVSEDIWLEICDTYDVKVNWANK